jgi:hypothetical protein
MKRSPIAISLALLATVTGLVGCSSNGHESRPSGKPDSSSPATPDQAMITWVGKVCEADDDLQAQRAATRVAALSMIPRRPTPEQIAGFVAVVRGDLEESVKKFQRLDNVNIDGGDQVIAAYVTAVKGALAKVENAEKMANDHSTPELLLTGLPQDVATHLEAAVPKGPGLPGLLARNPTLNLAYKQARSCNNASPLRATPSPTPTA